MQSAQKLVHLTLWCCLVCASTLALAAEGAPQRLADGQDLDREAFSHARHGHNFEQFLERYV